LLAMVNTRLPVFLLLTLLCFSLGAENNDGALNAVVEDNVQGYVFDITVENEQQLDAILKRADDLKGQFSPDQYGRIALVLHGDELRLFQKSNYERFMSIVDKARELDKNHLIDIKACRTAMDILHIQQSDLPDFIEQVPYAPVEVDRLVREQGYTRL
jgi:intracellular sulfur oxidation DsrE/DsrF family protein